ncbi:MAG: cytotoxin [Betaproteobacteria bacterium]|nr:MAG: cytotoxin [Betaproteobacteria bacterium]
MPPRVADRIRHLPADVKRSIREAIRQLCADPECGARLKRELEGDLKYTVRRYRIVCRVDRAAGAVNVLAIGHRRTIYEEAAEKVRGRRVG